MKLRLFGLQGIEDVTAYRGYAELGLFYLILRTLVSH